MNWKDAEKRFKRRYFVRALIAAQGRVAVAAKIAGLNRTHFYNSMRKFGIELEKIPHRDIRKISRFRVAHEKFLRKFFARAFAKAEGSPTRVSRLTGIDRPYLYRMARRVGLDWRGVEGPGEAERRASGARPPLLPREASRPAPPDSAR